MSGNDRVRAPFWLFSGSQSGNRRALHLPTRRAVRIDPLVASWLQQCDRPMGETNMLDALAELGVAAPKALFDRLVKSGMLLNEHDKYAQDFPGITLVGYGPFGLPTCPVENLQVIRDASVVFTLDPPQALGFLQDEAKQVVSLEHHLAVQPHEKVLQQVALLAFSELLQRPGSVFAFRGHPVVGSAPVKHLRRHAQTLGVPVTILLAPSFLDSIYAHLGLDPFAGLAVVRPWQIAEVSPHMICVVVGFGYDLSKADKQQQVERFCVCLRSRPNPVNRVTLLWGTDSEQYQCECSLDDLPIRLRDLPNGAASVLVDADRKQCGASGVD